MRLTRRVGSRAAGGWLPVGQRLGVSKMPGGQPASRSVQMSSLSKAKLCPSRGAADAPSRLVVLLDVSIGSLEELLLAMELVLEERSPESALDLTLACGRLLPTLEPDGSNDVV